MTTIIALLLAAATPGKAHKLPAITITARIDCGHAEKYNLRDPFTGHNALYCRVK